MRLSLSPLLRLLAAVLAAAALSPLARAEAPSSVLYEGRLSNAAGVPVSGAVAVAASLHGAATGGAALHAESHPAVPVVNGLFTLALTPPAALLAAGGPLFLELRVNGSLLTPRQPLHAAPYAQAVAAGSVGAAQIADGAVGAGQLADGAVTGPKIAPGSLSDADVASGAAIALSKLAADPSAAGTINQPGNPVDWTRLKNVPADLADGADREGLDVLVEGSLAMQATALDFAAGPFLTTAAGARGDAALNPSSVTLQGNAFNAPGRLLRLDASSRAPVAQGGTGADWSSAPTGSLPYFSGTGALGLLAPGANGHMLKLSGGLPVWAPELPNSAGNVDGTGTTGWIPLWAGAAPSTDTLTDSVLSQSGGRIGLNVPAPSVPLEVNGGPALALSGGGQLSMGPPSSPTTANLAMDQQRLQARVNGVASFFTLQDLGGDVGVGTATPARKLDVNGALSVGSFRLNGVMWNAWPASSSLPGGSVGDTLRRSGGAWTASSALHDGATRAGVGTASPAARLHVDGGVPIAGTGSGGGHALLGYLRLHGRKVEAVDNPGIPFFVQPNGGNVGVGTASPQRALDVNGDFNADVLCIAGDCRDGWPFGAANRSAVIATRSAAQSFPAGDSTPITFNAESLDLLGEFTPGPGGRFVPRFSGEYMVCVGLKSNAVSSYLVSVRTVSGVGYWIPDHNRLHESSGCLLQRIAAGTALEVDVYTFGGMTTTASALENWMTIHRVR